jgi:hypothetical protein
LLSLRWKTVPFRWQKQTSKLLLAAAAADRISGE